MPAFSNVHVQNPGDDGGNGYESQKGFVLDEGLGCPDIKKWSKLFLEVHGNNGMIGIAFFLSCLYRSYIFGEFDIFPLLNLFGPPGLGKSFMAQSMTAMFGKSRAPYNLQDGTDVGLFRTIAQCKDAIVFLDELNNQLHPKRFQALKNFYDGAGRIKGQKTQDNRTTTTAVNSGIILVGQQQPTQDPALFSRVISLNFGPRPLNDQAARKLKAIEGTTCLSQLTARLLGHRQAIREQFLTVYDEVVVELKKSIPPSVPKNVVSRVLKNNAIILATFKIISQAEQFSFSYKQLHEQAVKVMVKQLHSIGQEDDQAVWWDMIQFAMRKNELAHDKDLLVKYESVIDPGKGQKVIDLGGSKKVLYLHLDTAYRVYSRLLRQEAKDNGMPKTSIRHYLRGSESYLCEKTQRIDGGAKKVYVFLVENLPYEDLPLSSEVDDYFPGEQQPAATVAVAAPKTISSTGMTPEEDLPF